MRTLPINLVTRNIELNREPRVAIKILNDQGAFWLTTNADVDPGDGLDVLPNLIAASASSQSITPEKGFSTIGGMVIELQDQAFTERLRAIDAANDTINNNPAQVFLGFSGMDFADYGKLFTFIVDGIESDQLTYTLRLSDRQRLQKRGIFSANKTQLFAVIEGGIQKDLSVDTVLNGSGVIEVLSSDALPMVEHDDQWDTDPSTTVGYFQIKGVDAAGNDSVETFSFTGYDGSNPNRLTGVTRSRFGTSAIEARGSVNDGKTEVAEFIYIDLPLPKLILALMTGDLYGQPGATLPDHWHAGLSAADVDLASFENIGDDLWALPFSFENPSQADAKSFIASELLRATNLFFKINQDGEFELSRFAPVPQDAAPAHVFDESEIISISKISRDAKNIRNRFLFNWEWRSDLNRFVRDNIFIDLDSIARNNVISDTLVLNFKGVRNRSRDMLNSLQLLAEGIRARYSDAAIKPSMSTPLAYGLLPEVGDIVGINLAAWPDYANTANLNASFEIQATSIDLINQTASFQLFGTSGKPTPIDFGKGEDVATIDHTGWKELSAALTAAGISYTESGDTLTITGNGTLQGGDTTAAANRYYYEGNVTVADGVTLTVNKNFVLDALDIDLSGAKIDGSAGGPAGGQGAFLSFTPEGNQTTNYTLGSREYFGGEDLAEEGILKSIVGQDKLYRFPKNNGSVAAARSQVESINLRVDDNGIIQGFDGSSFLGSSGSGGMYSVTRDASGLDTVPSDAGDGGNGGASITLFCVNLFTNSSTVIDTSGGDATAPTVTPPIGGTDDWAGAGGPGWPGCLLVFVKLKSSPTPILTGRHVARVGTVPGLQTYEYYPKKSNSPVNVPSFGQYDSAGPLPNAAAKAYKGADLSSACRLVKFITSDTPATPVPGVDKVGPADLPTISLAEQINTPESPKGNISTITVTATPPADSRYSYAIFEYRALGQAAWYPLEYKLSDETTKELPTDGSTYEFSARSVSVSGQVSTARTIAAITLSVVSEEPEETNTDDAAIQVAQIRRLVLINAISDDADAQWKGPDAEFQWAKLRYGETNIESDPKQDMHLDGYRVQVFRTSDHKLLREVTVTDTFYTYTLADNRRDNVDSEGNPAPTRAITIKVAAVASTGVTSKSSSLSVSNPAPAPVTGVEVIYTLEGIEISYTPPGDVDFRGIKARDRLYTGTSITLAPMTARSETLEIVSVDQFGDGETLNYELVNTAPGAPALAVDGVGFTSAVVTVSYPSDYDLIGADVRVRTSAGPGPWSTPIRITDNQVKLEGLTQGTGHDVEVTPVDTLGPGTAATISFTTHQIDAVDVTGLGVWATQNEISAVFAQTYIAGGSINDALLAINSVIAEKIANGAVESIKLASQAVTNSKLANLAVDAAKLADSSVTATKIANLAVGTAAIQNLAVTDAKIGSLTAAKITAGQVVVQIDLGTGILLDGANGIIQTVNSGYSIFVGPVSRAAVSANPLVLHDWDDGISEGTFWYDLAGNYSLGRGGIKYNRSTNVTTFAGSVVIRHNATQGEGYLHLNGGAAAIQIGPAQTFASQGIQFEYNSGTPRAYLGNGTDNFIRYNGATVEIETDNFSVDAAGNATYGGTLVAASGSIANITGTNITITGASVFGDDSTDSFISFDSVTEELNVGAAVELKGSDSYNNTSFYERFAGWNIEGEINTGFNMTVASDLVYTTFEGNSVNSGNAIILRFSQGLSRFSWDGKVKIKFAYGSGSSGFSLPDTNSVAKIGVGDAFGASNSLGGVYAQLTYKSDDTIDLQLYVKASGSASTTISAVTNIPGDGATGIIEIIHDPAVGEVRLYQGPFSDELTLIATVTTNLPSGQVGDITSNFPIFEIREDGTPNIRYRIFEIKVSNEN